MIKERVDDSFIRVLKSCEKAINILRSKGVDIEPLSEKNTPANWQELRRLHSDLWRRVYGKTKREVYANAKKRTIGG